MCAFHNKKGQQLQKPFPRFIEGIVEMLDLSSGGVATKRLTDRAHRDGSLRREPNRDATDLSAVQAIDKQNNVEPRRRSRDKRYGRSAIKMLVAEEMGKGGGERQQREQPSVIARLMGLSSSSQPRQSDSAAGKNSPCKDHMLNDDSQRLKHPSKGNAVENRGPRKHQPCLHGSRVFDESSDHMQDQSSRMAARKCPDELSYEKRMSLVRQKFAEARRLAVDEKLLHSKEFHDTLQFLSTNRELFMKFLEEPDGLLTQLPQEHQSATSDSHVKQISILKPPQLIRTKSDSLIQKQFCSEWEEEISNVHRHHRSLSISPPKSPLSRPTRIVVLKPGLGLERTPHPETNLAGSNDIFTCQMPEKIASQLEREDCQQDDACEILSDISDIRTIGEEEASVSDFGTPTSGHSWDCLSISGSPYSSSYYSLSSPLHESAVVREAKKRISERWARVASIPHSRDRIEDIQSASTLGEMLTISKRQNVAQDMELSSIAHEHGAKLHDLHLPRCKSDSGNSLPDQRIIECSTPAGRTNKSGKPSGTGKASSSFLSRILRSSREKPLPSNSQVPLSRVKQGASEGPVLYAPDNELDCSSHLHHAEGDLDNFSSKEISSASSLRISEPFDDSQDGPSPVSVLDASLLDDYSNGGGLEQGLSRTRTVGLQQTLCRSPLIGSVARSLSWDSCPSEVTSPNSQRLSRLFTKADDDQNSFLFIQKLVSAAGLGGDASEVLHTRWHTASSPLGSHLLDSICYTIGDGVSFRERQSKERLLFDCANKALSEIAERVMVGAYPWQRRAEGWSLGGGSMGEEVWNVIRSWWLYDRAYPPEFNEKGPGVALVWEREAAGRGWADSLLSETFDMDAEICEAVLEDLVEAAAMDLAFPAGPDL